VVFDGVQSLDLTGPLEVFNGADQHPAARQHGGYDVCVAAPDPGPVVTSSGLSLLPHAVLSDLRGPIDTLVVAGGDGTYRAVDRPELVREVRRLAKRARRVTSVCSGAFLLAEAGLLDGRRATTHWSRCAAFAERYPAVTVDPDPIFVRDGNVATSAGVTAGMDLALALVEEDLGRDAALIVARMLVLFLRRPGNQSQFSAQLSGQLADRDEIRELQRWVTDHPGADCTVEALARHAGMSPRHLTRVFTEQVGVTPARYVERTRVEHARRRLEESTDPIEVVVAQCGFGTAETMRRAFVRALGIPPAEYRRRFRAVA
jgi:transcriptional regulator GlxA family with amidase domain